MLNEDEVKKLQQILEQNNHHHANSLSVEECMAVRMVLAITDCNSTDVAEVLDRAPRTIRGHAIGECSCVHDIPPVKTIRSGANTYEFTE